MLRVGFEGDQTATRLERPRQPDAAVAAQRADLQNLRRARQLRQQHEQLALAGADADRRQPGCITGRQRRIEDGIGGHQQIRGVLIDRRP